MSKRLLQLLAVFCVGVMFATGYYLGGRVNNDANQQKMLLGLSGRQGHPEGRTSAPQLWVCPMHPHIHQDHSGRCPICGMELVRRTGTPDHDGGEGVPVDSAMQQRLGVRLVQAQRMQLRHEVRTWGTVAINESSLVEISPKVDGWVRKLYVSFEGEAIRAGQVLYEIYSPELVQRQREYIDLLQRREQLLQSMTQLTGQNGEMLSSLARERMRARRQFEYADLNRETIDQIEKSRRTEDVVMIHARNSGVVTRIGARAGTYVTPQTNLLTLADLSRVWIDIALYPDQLPWVSAGNAVVAKPQGVSHAEIKGVLELPGGQVDAASRTVHARLVARNPRLRLRPGTYVDITILGPPHDVLAIPRSAVIRTGNGDKVMLANGNGHFSPTPVRIGLEGDDFVEVSSGLSEADQVAVSGQFLLDSAASLHDTKERMQDDH